MAAAEAEAVAVAEAAAGAAAAGAVVAVVVVVVVVVGVTVVVVRVAAALKAARVTEVAAQAMLVVVHVLFWCALRCASTILDAVGCHCVSFKSFSCEWKYYAVRAA